MSRSADKSLNFDDFLRKGVDPIDAIQMLRRELGADKNTQVTMRISAWGLDMILEGWEHSLKRARG